MAPSGGVISGISRSAVLLAQLVLEHFATHRLGERIGEDHPLGRLEACKSFTANIDQLPPARRIGAHRHDHRHDGLAPALVGQPDDSGLCHLGVPMEDRRYPGFPIAEVEQDGSSVITKHADTGGLVSVGTVTAQLLYEIARPAYANPDAVAHFDTIQLTQEGPDRVRISGVKGTPPPSDLKVALNYMGGYRNSMTLVLTGLDIEAKADWATQELFSILGGKERFAEVDVHPARFDREDSPDNELATAHLRITVKDPDPKKVGRAFSNATMELALGGYAGFHTTTPPSAESAFGVYWPTLVPSSAIRHRVVPPDGSEREVPHLGHGRCPATSRRLRARPPGPPPKRSGPHSAPSAPRARAIREATPTSASTPKMTPPSSGWPHILTCRASGSFFRKRRSWRCAATSCPISGRSTLLSSGC